MRHVLRRTPRPFSAGSFATPPENLRAGYFLFVLPPAHQFSRQARTRGSGGEPDRQRDQFLPQQTAAGAVPEERSRRAAAPQTGTPGLDTPPVERRLLDRTGTLQPGHDGVRRAGLLLPAQPSAV